MRIGNRICTEIYGLLHCGINFHNRLGKFVLGFGELLLALAVRQCDGYEAQQDKAWHQREQNETGFDAE